MTVSPLAFSISNSLTQAGAIAAFVALVGIAVLSLLVFAQARELKRLREWAGRAPERSAELEQRVAADAAARAQRPAQPVRTVPRATPINVRAASAVGPATRVVSGAPLADPPPGVDQAELAPESTNGKSAQESTPGAVGQPPAGATPSADALPAAEALSPSASAPAGSGETQAVGGVPAEAAVVPSAAAAASATKTSSPGEVVSAGGESSVVAEKTPQTVTPSSAPGEAVEPAASKPATAAARAAGSPPRAPVPPAGGVSTAEGAQPASPRPAQSRPPAPAAPRRSASDVRPSVAPRSAAGGSRSRPPATPLLQEPRSPARVTALILGGVVIGVVILVVAISALKGGGGAKHGTSTTASNSTTTSSEISGRTHKTTHKHVSTEVAANPAETRVVVLNATETPELAHHLSANLQQSGYTESTPLSAHPSESRTTTVVEYVPGHRLDAQHVAQTLGVSQVAPLSSSTQALVGQATVAVIAGADQAALGTSSGGGSAGSGATGAGQ
jgi:hypothetical protein